MAAVQAQVESRRAEVRGVLEAAAVEDPAEGCRFVGADWLRGWADDAGAPGPIDNSGLLCPHGDGQLDPRKVAGALGRGVI